MALMRVSSKDGVEAELCDYHHRKWLQVQTTGEHSWASAWAQHGPAQHACQAPGCHWHCRKDMRIRQVNEQLRRQRLPFQLAHAPLGRSISVIQESHGGSHIALREPFGSVDAAVSWLQEQGLTPS